jgi:hypothetical protein
MKSGKTKNKIRSTNYEVRTTKYEVKYEIGSVKYVPGIVRLTYFPLRTYAHRTSTHSS